MTRAELDAHRAEAERLLRRMIALQEELDWRCYILYGVTDQDLCYRAATPSPQPSPSKGKEREEDGIFVEYTVPPEIEFGQRAFEIAMARQMASGKISSTWFERHRSKPITEIPAHWPEDYRRLVERRIALIGSDRYLGLIERPEHKRRWNPEPWEAQEQRALRAWLVDRLETGRYWPELRLQTTRSLADRAETDADFMRVAERYVGHPGFDLHPLVAELVEGESVPFLPVLRYKPSGLRKRAVWEETGGSSAGRMRSMPRSKPNEQP
jgi:hypothetical protein